MILLAKLLTIILLRVYSIKRKHLKSQFTKEHSTTNMCLHKLKIKAPTRLKKNYYNSL